MRMIKTLLVLMLLTVGVAEANVYRITLVSASEPVKPLIQWYSDTEPIVKMITAKWVGANGMKTIIASTGAHTVLIEEMAARPVQPVAQPVEPTQPSE